MLKLILHNKKLETGLTLFFYTLNLYFLFNKHYIYAMLRVGTHIEVRNSGCYIYSI